MAMFEQDFLNGSIIIEDYDRIVPVSIMLPIITVGKGVHVASRSAYKSHFCISFCKVIKYRS